MVFSSMVFLFLFLPIVLVGYLLLSIPQVLGSRRGPWNQWRNLWILIASLVFYAWGEPVLIVVMLASALVDFSCGLGISQSFGSRRPIPQLIEDGQRTRGQTAWLLLSICFGIGLLSTFKYSKFVIENFNMFVQIIGLPQLSWVNSPTLRLPLGISFYTFQSMSYTIDVYRGKTRANNSILSYLCFVTLFPQLIAGPIVRYVNIAAELSGRLLSWPLFASGVQRFVFGLGKKVLIANTLAGPADKIFGVPSANLTPELAWVGILAYALQLYFDFSGYSDMAIGLGRMLGFHFIENFNYPYIAQSVTEFWRRWHMSLSTWFKDYLYIPLGGSRYGRWRTYRNLIVVFFLCGLWHGANWTFLAWGMMHGTLLVVERVGFGRWLTRAWRPVGHVYTLLFVICAWVVFRSDTLATAQYYFSALAGGGGVQSPDIDVWDQFTSENLLVFVIGVTACTPFFSWLPSLVAGWGSGSGWRAVAGGFLQSGGRLAILSFVLVASAARLSAGTYNPFIYFRF